MPEPMDAEAQTQYLRMAEEQSDILCAQVPDIILEFASAEAEPTPFMEEFFATGYAAWMNLKHGRRINLPQDLIDRAILVLWNRAGLLYTDRITGKENADSDKPFFSDEGLY